MLATLQSATDPVALVVGSVDALDADADYLASRARILDASADAVAHATPSWSGTASEGWFTRRTELTGSLRAIAEVYRAVADELRTHASVLFWAQQRAQVAIDLWTRGVATGNAPRRSVPYATGRPGTSADYLSGSLASVRATALSGTVQPLDPGATAKLEAQEVLANALVAVSTSARTLEHLLDSLSDGLPDGRFNIEDLLAGIGSWFAEIGSMIGKFNAGRLVLDPRGYATDVGAVVTGVEDTYTMITDDPLAAPAKLADLNGLHDNPGHWWGKVGMEVAVAAVPIGASLAVKMSARASAGLVARDAVASGDAVTFTSADAHVAEAAHAIEQAMPGRVVGVNTNVRMTNGSYREVDIDLGDLIVQVKMDNARGLTAQMLRTLDSTGRPVIGYAPDIPNGAWMNAARQGIAIARDTDELVAMVQEMG